MKLTQRLDNTMIFEGRKYRLRLFFDTVLSVFDLLRDDLFFPHERLALACEILGGRNTRKLSATQHQAFYQQVYDRYIDAGGKPTPKGKPRVLDFAQDAGMIYSAFHQAYSIDLMKERGRMDWRVFIALLQSLPEGTKLREVMAIRGRDIPEPTKYNAKEIAALMEAKAYYAIQFSETEAEQAFQAGVDRLTGTLVSRAKAGG